MFWSISVEFGEAMFWISRLTVLTHRQTDIQRYVKYYLHAAKSVTISTKFGRFMCVNITYISIEAVSWPDSILSLEAIFLRGHIGISILHFWLHSIFGLMTPDIFEGLWVKHLPLWLDIVDACYFSLIDGYVCLKVWFYLLSEWHIVQGCHICPHHGEDMYDFCLTSKVIQGH